MTESEKVIVNKLIGDSVLKLCIIHADDILIVIRRSDIAYDLNKFNSFDSNLKLKTSTFEKCVSHFLDIEIFPNGLGIYYKQTHTGQYLNYEPFTLWKCKISWIR